MGHDTVITVFQKDLGKLFVGCEPICHHLSLSVLGLNEKGVPPALLVFDGRGRAFVNEAPPDHGAAMRRVFAVRLQSLTRATDPGLNG